MSVAHDWDGDDFEFYDRVVAGLVANTNIYDRKAYRSNTDPQIMDEINLMAVRAVENRRKLYE